jgi:hypothetical protein
MNQPYIALKAARMAARRTLVQVAAAADCSIGYVRQYEIDPNSLGDQRKRARLDQIYAAFPKAQAA